MQVELDIGVLKVCCEILVLGYAKACKLLFLSTLSCNTDGFGVCVGLTLCHLLVLRVVSVLTNVP